MVLCLKVSSDNSLESVLRATRPPGESGEVWFTNRTFEVYSGLEMNSISQDIGSA